jgi:uncharacterized protein HemY
MTLIQELMNQSSLNVFLEGGGMKRFPPAEIREAIQSLVATEQINLAYALGDAGLAIYPNSEDMLAINGLLAIIRQDWIEAVELLTELMEFQGSAVQPFTYVMLVRALRCNLDPAAAMNVVRKGLEQYPNQLELVAESLALEEYAHAMTPTSALTQ